MEDQFHQADGVFQGGGVKGIALAGALEEFGDSALHQQNYVDDWVQLAGTSAGAIIAAFLACGHSVEETAALVKGTDFAKFEDWGPGGEIIGGAINLALHHGLAHGKVFHDWFRDQIKDQTFGDVEDAKRTLKLIATDITRREMLVLPDALPNYRVTKDGPPIDPKRFAVADAVRMSMSIPYFFQPVELIHHETGIASTIVDGGVLSNFPVWIFDVEDRDPLRPTFGFKLIGGRGVGGGLGRIVQAFGWPVEMGVDIFHTTTEAWDKYWVSHSTYVRTCTISAGDIGTTDFNLTEQQKDWLLESG
ncbi:MAG TPA: patatin-like phospholipase family protein, partial [Solirubrobacteraceae bacterium]|nr:patatin-like phospholipase family protein [Solirubrobacteraceae bacterium]